MLQAVIFSKDNQLMSRNIPQEKLSKMTRNRPMELIMLMKHQQPFQVAFNSTLQFVNPDAGVIFQRMHLSKVQVKSNIRQRM